MDGTFSRFREFLPIRSRGGQDTPDEKHNAYVRYPEHLVPAKRFRDAVSSVLEVYKEDPRHPRIIHSKLDGRGGVKLCGLEFDTIESAREWRRELQGEYSQTYTRIYQ